MDKETNRLLIEAHLAIARASKAVKEANENGLKPYDQEFHAAVNLLYISLGNRIEWSKA